MPPGYVGRFAPSPTGDLHLGNLLAAIGAYARARRAAGRFLLRIEDLDRPRVVADARERIEEDLAWLGFVLDGPVVVQSAQPERYEAALARLRAAGAVYACSCSRKDLGRIASAPHDGDDGPPYPQTCRDRGLPLDDPARPVSWRFAVGPGEVVIEDALRGVLVQDVARCVGDFVVRRRDGVVSYQLAVVVDDAWQGVTEVVRGADLLSSTPRQVLLHRALGQIVPGFAHVPLWVDETGHRMAKRAGPNASTIRRLREQGASPSDVLGLVARALGVAATDRPFDLEALCAALTNEVLAAAAVTDNGPLGPTDSARLPSSGGARS